MLLLAIQITQCQYKLFKSPMRGKKSISVAECKESTGKERRSNRARQHRFLNSSALPTRRKSLKMENHTTNRDPRQSEDRQVTTEQNANCQAVDNERMTIKDRVRFLNPPDSGEAGFAVRAVRESNKS
jgi:macrodomain Ter protein organizer (MatP/YcbG family)